MPFSKLNMYRVYIQESGVACGVYILYTLRIRLVAFEVAVVAIEIQMMRRITFAISTSCERSCGFERTRRTSFFHC
jgi:hypothetical protein